MKVTSSPAPSPAPSPPALQTTKLEVLARSAAPPVLAPSITPPKPEMMEPMVVNMLGVQIELQPNELARVVDKMNETARIFNHTLRFELADRHRIRVRVLDSSTGQVVREIPPDEFLATFARLQDLVGVILDQRV